VTRGGRRIKISIFDLVVGDLVQLNIGDQVKREISSYHAFLYHVITCTSYFRTMLENCMCYLRTTLMKNPSKP
jgi:hypothetical protein